MLGILVTSSNRISYQTLSLYDMRVDCLAVGQQCSNRAVQCTFDVTPLLLIRGTF